MRTFCTVLLALVLLFSPDGTGPPASIGERAPDHEWTMMAGHDGRTRLRELIGHPVVIAGFRRHLVDGIHASLVGSELLSKHEKDGLILIMEDRMAWKEGWVEPVAFWHRTAGYVPWLTPSPDDGKTPDLGIVRTAPRDARSLVLIGVDGTLVAEGTAELATEPEKQSDFRARFKRLVAQEIARARSGWGTDPVAREARALAFGKGQIAAALSKLHRDGNTDIPERREVLSELEWRVAGWTKSVRFYLDEGRPNEAEDAMKRLSAAVRGAERWEEALAPLAAEIDSPEVKEEKSLDRKLAKIVEPLDGKWRRGKIDVEILRELRAFAEKQADNRVGARAKRLDPLIKSLLATALGLRHSAIEERLRKN